MLSIWSSHDRQFSNLAVGNDRVKQNVRPVDSVRLSLVSGH